MKTDYETLKIETPGPHLLRVTLNRPQVANAFNTQMGRDLEALWTSVIAEPVAEIYTNPRHRDVALEYFRDVAAFEREAAARRAQPRS